MLRIDHNTKQKLLKNWGDQANTLHCYAEVCFYDPLTRWKCYILAMSPDDEDEILCIIDNYETVVCNWSLQELYEQYNFHGERLVIDPEFRKIWASTLYNKLNFR